jgi:hypothetical protein
MNSNGTSALSTIQDAPTLQLLDKPASFPTLSMEVYWSYFDFLATLWIKLQLIHLNAEHRTNLAGMLWHENHSQFEAMQATVETMSKQFNLASVPDCVRKRQYVIHAYLALNVSMTLQNTLIYGMEYKARETGETKRVASGLIKDNWQQKLFGKKQAE